MYFVYILRTSGNTLYTGQTNNLERRLKEHRDKTSKSAKYVRYFKTVELVYQEKWATRAEAMRRETELKKLTRKKKDDLISGNI
jgi:putative endonuclease